MSFILIFHVIHLRCHTLPRLNFKVILHRWNSSKYAKRNIKINNNLIKLGYFKHVLSFPQEFSHSTRCTRALAIVSRKTALVYLHHLDLTKNYRNQPEMGLLVSAELIHFQFRSYLMWFGRSIDSKFLNISNFNFCLLVIFETISTLNSIKRVVMDTDTSH